MSGGPSNEEQPVIPDSPIIHRRNRGFRPAPNCDGSSLVPEGDDAMTRLLLPPSACDIPATREDATLTPSDDDALIDNKSQCQNGKHRCPTPEKNQRGSHSGEDNPADDELTQSLPATTSGAMDSPRSLGSQQQPSPVPVTLLGVDVDLRRKRIKKVSNYILGPLLGEGVYGVVRDGLCLAGDKVTRCAVKMVSTSTGNVVDYYRRHQQHNSGCRIGGVAAGEGLSRARLQHREAHIREVVQAESVNLQRFHNKHIIRALDIFTRYGKQYVVLPIAICSLEQLVDHSQRTRHEAAAKHRIIKANARLLVGSAPRRNPVTAAAPIGMLYRRHDADDGETTDTSSQRTIDSYTSLRDGTRSPIFDVVGPSVSGPPTDHTAGAPSTCGDAAECPAGTANGKGPTESSCEPLLPTLLIKGIMLQLLSGIAYLHAQSLAHNDVKASNVLLFESGTVRLSDLGSVAEHYHDKGTPLYAAPELCKYFYGVSPQPPELPEGNTGHLGTMPGGEDEKATLMGSCDEIGNQPAIPVNHTSGGTETAAIDARCCDMWSCGLTLYYLITGKPGPLAVHRAYWLHQTGAATDGCSPKRLPINRYQLYKAIAAQEAPVDLEDLPDLVVDSGARGPTTADCFSGANTPRMTTCTYPPDGVRHLLSGLLELDPRKRLTAAEALLHPWVTLTFRISSTAGSSNGNVKSSNPNDARRLISSPRVTPSRQAMEDAIQRDVARRVLQAVEVETMILKDRERHLQFAADCCHILGIPIPPEVVKPSTAEPYDDDDGGRTAVTTEAFPRLSPRHGPPQLPPRGGRGGAVVDGTVVSPYSPSKMPTGCVDTALFLPFNEENYYERKSGKTEFDVRVLRDQPLKVRMVEEYLHHVCMVNCGYRTGPDPGFAATRTPFLTVTSPTAATHTGLSPNNSATLVSGGGGNNRAPRTITSPGHSLVIVSGSGHTSLGGRLAGRSPVSAQPFLGNNRSNRDGRGVPVMGVPQVSAVESEDDGQRNFTSGPQRGSEQQRLYRFDGANAEGAEAMRESSKCLCGLV